jgi:hypothetical protein
MTFFLEDRPFGTFTRKEATSFACRTNAKAQATAAANELESKPKKPDGGGSPWSAKVRPEKSRI